MTTSVEHRQAIRSEVRRLADKYGNEYWRSLEPDRYPEEFVADLTAHGWLAALIPEEYGGGGLDLTGASVILEEIAASGGNPSACHAQMYVMGTLLRHGSEEMKQHYLPAIAEGKYRLQAFGVTEPTAGSDTSSIRTKAERQGDNWVITGQKIWTSRALYSDLMVLLARTSPVKEGQRPFDGLSVFLIHLRDDQGDLVPGLTINPIPTMMNHSTTEVFFDKVTVTAAALIGTEGQGFRHILDGMNAERILIASECIGDGRFFIERGSAYATERHVFGRPIGQNQGVQFPLAKAYASLQAADLMRYKAAELFDRGEPCGAEANMAKLLASEASWAAGNAALDTHGGFGFATEYDIERKLRETRLYQVAPINNNLILAFLGEKVLGMPKSY
ncbi:MAG: acyl-CoA/acyl-ACP dehydrogenase [Actinobacteria bacterium]|jgi:acyl-CoA dehydrogenase|nr:acyl-CoA/acyl-ACP dehydrogenase [Actinomycetota bacterium]MBT3746899.1 acyl-CoA/acyl-ACP dehydrogenase [Actinomycetota bacterium]MBT3970232.1 acyl-CoA/acyl-ACP dehydrogenase [Actinomycetota bacterium]MBT4010155.1 acyl-CoA/acyl-ACP dehydrogenase [Actinomycetota bacterium]MBT4303074.1 acyl-CoA/acyl-ACP dehydrogenase [Actinomycetota bacterium]